MCDLCSMSNETRRDAMEFRAKQLREFADELLRNVGYGKISLHSVQAEQIGIKARELIRFMVEDWL